MRLEGLCYICWNTHCYDTQFTNILHYFWQKKSTVTCLALNKCVKAISYVWFHHLTVIKGRKKDPSTTEIAQHGVKSATFWGVVCKRAVIWRGCFGYWKIQIGTSVFHIDPLHGLIWPGCKGQFSPNLWYQNSPAPKTVSYWTHPFWPHFCGQTGSFHLTV